jgi:septal ring-binding cell division protein DamX
MLLNDDDEDNLALSPNARRKSRRGTMATDKSGSSPRRSPGKRASIASRKDDEEDAQDIEQSYAYDNGPMDDGGQDDEDMMVDEELAEEEIGLEEDDEPMNAEADANEDEDSGEETAVERPVSKAKKAKTKATKPKPVRRARSRANSDASTSSASPIKRARVSGFPLIDGESA